MQRAILVLFLGILAAAMGAAKDKSAKDALSPRLRHVIDDVEAAYAAGDIEKVWQVLAPVITAQKDEVAARFDEALAARKLPASRELLVEARLKLLMEDRTGALPAPTNRERLLILEALQDHVQNPLEQIGAQILLKDEAPPPKNMAEFDRRFNDIRKLRGKLLLAETCARYAAGLAARLPAALRKKLTDQQRNVIAQSEGDLATKVHEAAQDVLELELETCLQRLRYGVDVLKTNPVTKEKFIATASTRQDARVLQQAFAPPPAPPPARKGGNSKGPAKPAVAAPAPPVFHRPALTAPDVADQVTALARAAEKAAGPLGEKAERFLTGLGFWLRGRYGWGPDVWGLAKSSAALQQPELLQQVYMPQDLLMPEDADEQPKMADPGRIAEGVATKEKKKPRLLPGSPDRRHHYTWAWEDRRLVSSTNEQEQFQNVQIKDYAVWIDGSNRPHSILDMGNGTFTGKGFSATERAWGPGDFRTHESTTSVRVPPQDPRLVYRIVGFIEYSQALQHLDKFVEEATPAEFKVAEEIVRSQQAFRIQTNLSRNLEGASALSERSPDEYDDFSRHGLEWMLALARTEVGAMLAGFTSHAEPFLVLAPTTYRQEEVKTVPFGTAAYAEVLLDGLRTHYWSIVRQDLIAAYYKTGVPESHLVTYGRRAMIGRQFVRALLKYSGSGGGGENLPFEPRTELATWDQTFEKLQRIMLYCLTFKVGQQKATVHDLDDSFASHGRWLKIDRDQTPDAIRRLLLLVDPTLAGCGCR